MKKSLFSIQRVAIIAASRAAAIFFFLVGKYCPFLEKNTFFFAKMKIKVFSGFFLSHPAALPETIIFMDSLGWTQTKWNLRFQCKFAL